MQVLVNTSNGIENKDSLERWASEFLNDALARFGHDVTRIEVQMSDTSTSRSGAQDKRCTLEARIAGHEPVVATHHAASQDEAFRGATQRLTHVLERTLGKLDRREHRDRETIRREGEPAE